MALPEAWTNSNGFKNRYFIIRHGQSEANVAQIVSSHYSVSIAQHGLTELGAQQAHASASILRELAIKPPVDIDLLDQKTKTQAKDVKLSNLHDIVFYASDFKRAFETAQYCRKQLKADWDGEVLDSTQTTSCHTPPLYTSPALRERHFGQFEGLPSDNAYDQVWERDALTEPTSQHYGVESIQSVINRTTSLILELEEIWSNKCIVLVAHGDICQILQAGFVGVDPRKHRSLPHFNNCDCKELLLVLQ